MTGLIAAAVFFVLLHLLVSGTGLRGAMVRRIGEGPYMGLFSLASVGGLVWLGWAYGQVKGAGPVYWDLGPGARHTAVALMLLALLLAVPGLLTPNPTSVKQEGALDRPDAVKGMLRITRHPFLWGVAIWAFAHLLANGDLPGVILFGSLLVLAVFGTASIDAKRRKALGAKWDAFAGQTSGVPFAAILGGKQTLALGEIGWWRLLLAIVVWAALLWGHPILFGVNPLG
ncbi:MAG TPA: NnrU family protein [Caulobacter sp.]|nr:NnrU family protein [Caulobacter sp.]